MMNPKETKHVVLDGHSLNLESFVAVARYNATVELAGSAAYNSVMYQEPLPFAEYRPFLYRAVRLIIKSHREP